MRSRTSTGCSARGPGSEGFTLIEAVFALAVTALALVFLVSAGQYAADATAASANRTKAVTLGAGLAERMQLGGVGSGGSIGAFEGAPAFRWELRTAGLPRALEAIMCRKATLSVFYPSLGGREEHIELHFLIPSE